MHLHGNFTDDKTSLRRHQDNLQVIRGFDDRRDYVTGAQASTRSHRSSRRFMILFLKIVRWP